MILFIHVSLVRYEGSIFCRHGPVLNLFIASHLNALHILQDNHSDYCWDNVVGNILHRSWKYWLFHTWSSTRFGGRVRLLLVMRLLIESILCPVLSCKRQCRPWFEDGNFSIARQVPQRSLGKLNLGIRIIEWIIWIINVMIL